MPFFTNKILREGDTDSDLQYRVNQEMEGLEAAWIESSEGVKVEGWDLSNNYGFTTNTYNEAPTDEELASFKSQYIEKYKTQDIPGVDRGLSKYGWEWYNIVSAERVLDDIDYAYDSSFGGIKVIGFH